MSEPIMNRKDEPRPGGGSRATYPTPPTCPECGASYDCRDTDAVFKDCDNWKCGSWKIVDSGCFHQSKQCQEDSLVIRVASLTRQLAELDATREERDAAISLLLQLNPNRGLFLNGVAIGWHRDHIAGFVAGIGGSKTIYPNILSAIRAALAKGGGENA